MVSHPNFYETIAEANMRLRGTFVLYGGEPYNVLCISNHRDDGIFRIYLEPIGGGEMERAFYSRNPPPVGNYSSEDPNLGVAMDAWMEAHPSKVIRKMMNSPAFNKFRPFPLGMCNHDGKVFYLERKPNRKTEQGLIGSMISYASVELGTQRGNGRGCVDLYGGGFRDCILGVYPTLQECITEFSDDSVINDAVAFHRHFAIVRGPIGIIFLAYKGDIIGVLPKNDASEVRISRDFAHTYEVVDALGVFSKIDITSKTQK